MKVRFWGVRGSIPTPNAEYMQYGGNTPCIEIRATNNTLLILEAGTGIRKLGKKLMDQAYLPHGGINILISHHHWDHIQGFPFFEPAFHDKHKIFVFGAPQTDYRIHTIMEGQMAYPYFPVSLDQMRAKIRFAELKKDCTQVADSLIQTFPLNHPQGANGFRIEADGKIFAYASDTEHRAGQIDKNIVALARDADFLVYDCTYTPEEYERKKGWGHSTYREGLAIAHEAGVGRFGVFHHDPEHDDAFMDRIASEVGALSEHALVTREGMEIEL
ncbi:MAG: MBL fold metallo-hydrolase [Deltaproteobacteria bacterium]|nr:MBL fold metallo-hydrolase [Deltaproteobacteria bacterium]